MSEFLDFARNGAMYVGVVVAWITWFVSTKMKEFDTTTIVRVLAALFAGVVVSFLTKGQPDQLVSDVLGRYSFGLLIGSAVYYVVYRLSLKKWPTEIVR